VPDADVIEQAPDAVITTDVTGAVSIWNRRATELFGFSKEDIVAGGLDLIIPENLRGPHWRGFSTALAAGKVKSHGRAVLTKAMHKDGRKLYVELSFSILNDAAGSPIGAIAIARDVTEEHAARRAAPN
jgi:PAS domain S-box-containing protein